MFISSQGQAAERNRTGVANQNADLERQGCSPFYEALFDDPYVNVVNFTLSPSFWLSSVCVFLLQLYLFLSLYLSVIPMF